MKGKIFNAQEIQTILNGSKVMFREVTRPQLSYRNPEIPRKLVRFEDESGYRSIDRDNEWVVSVFERCPYRVGQKIFVKERFKELWDAIYYENEKSIFRKEHLKVSPYRPAQQMKQEHSRITLEITDIKVERLAEISKEDAIKEGATSRPNCHGYANRYEGWCMNWNKVGEASKWASNRKTLSESDICMGSAQYAFGNFWNSTHKKPEEKFEANPFVWVVDFKINK